MPSPTLRRSVSLTLSSAIYLAVTVYAGGGSAAFFANGARMALFALTLLLTVAAFFAGGNLSPGVREDRGNRWVIAAFGVLGVLSAVVPPYFDHIDIWTFGGETVRWLGVALLVAGGTLRLAPVFTLGERFSGLVAIQPGHRLETGGLYRFIRHPSYLGLVIGAFGWALVFHSVVGVILASLNVPPLIARIRAEEALLAETFGAEYEAYRARTARLAPGIY